jgi:hypothetical protein
MRFLDLDRDQHIAGFVHCPCWSHTEMTHPVGLENVHDSSDAGVVLPGVVVLMRWMNVLESPSKGVTSQKRGDA